MKRKKPAPEPTRPEPARCEFCGKTQPRTRWRRRAGLRLDHCHETGAFRAWLCTRCNNMAGAGVADILERIRLIGFLGAAYSTATRARIAKQLEGAALLLRRKPTSKR